MGCYQRMLIVILSMIQFICGGLFLLAPYIFYQEPYQCPSSAGELNCHSYVCSLPAEERLAFTPESPLKSISSDYGDFRCSTEKLGIDMYISLMLLGKIAGAAIMALIGNRLSRKGSMLLAETTIAIGLVTALTAHSLMITSIGLFITIAGVQNCFYLTFAILTEEVPESHRSVYSVLIQMMFGVGVLMNVLWAYWLQEWKVILFACYFIPIMVMLVATHVLVIDTPLDLITRNCASSALIAFEQLARMNGKYSNHSITLMDIHEIKNKYALKIER
jgi:MFS family permease